MGPIKLNQKSRNCVKQKKMSRFLKNQQALFITFLVALLAQLERFLNPGRGPHKLQDFSTVVESPINCMTDSHSKLGFPNDTAMLRIKLTDTSTGGFAFVAREAQQLPLQCIIIMSEILSIQIFNHLSYQLILFIVVYIG